MLSQWHVKDPDQSAKSAGGRLQLNTHTSVTHRSRNGLTMLSRFSVGTRQGNELTCNSSGYAHLQSSQLAEPLWTDSWPKDWNWRAKADLHLKKQTSKKQPQVGND